MRVGVAVDSTRVGGTFVDVLVAAAAAGKVVGQLKLRPAACANWHTLGKTSNEISAGLAGAGGPLATNPFGPPNGTLISCSGPAVTDWPWEVTVTPPCSTVTVMDALALARMITPEPNTICAPSAVNWTFFPSGLSISKPPEGSVVAATSLHVGCKLRPFEK